MDLDFFFFVVVDVYNLGISFFMYYGFINIYLESIIEIEGKSYVNVSKIFILINFIDIF